jgi:hypothetical protein
VIELPSRGERDYLAQFGVTAVYVTSSGKLSVGRDLARVGPVAAAWWVASRREAEQVLVAIGQHPRRAAAVSPVELMPAVFATGN